jgi:hypothetical protein
MGVAKYILRAMKQIKEGINSCILSTYHFGLVEYKHVCKDKWLGSSLLIVIYILFVQRGPHGPLGCIYHLSSGWKGLHIWLVEDTKQRWVQGLWSLLESVSGPNFSLIYGYRTYIFKLLLTLVHFVRRLLGVPKGSPMLWSKDRQV